MKEVIDDVIALRGPDPRGLSRMMTVSFSVHVAIVLFLFLLPREWLVAEKAKPRLMTISLGVSAGERTGGKNPIGARPVEQVTPPPTRPEPVRPVDPKTEPAPVTMKTPPQTAKPSQTPSPAPTRAPTIGSQVTPGTSPVETGSTVQGTGVSFGGGVGGGVTELDENFCCPQWADELRRRISANWRSAQPERGTTVIKFTVRRDGTFTPPIIEVSSGSTLLDLTSKDAFSRIRFQPLPAEYKEETLTVHLKFTYLR